MGIQKTKQKSQHAFAIAVLLMEEEEEEESLLLWAYKKPSKKVSKIFTTRETEGVFNLTVEKRLFGKDQKFREYFRLSTQLFQIVLEHIKEDVTKLPYNRHKNPISPEEKLSITLR
ncbi:hypothetical protein QE152_g30529 [Popillia japonica]|uniref:Uncharacterized protein n=1 Tax=Popillia japonica TaxID=7064 RepID=A0AAW1JEM8_POPJA